MSKLTEDLVHVTGLHVGADDGIQLFVYQDESGIKVPTIVLKRPGGGGGDELDSCQKNGDG
jgi:hypothetical protein